MAEEDKINICLACDDNYSKYAGVVIASALANASDDENLAFYVLDGGISEEHKTQINELKSIKACEINFVEIDESLFDEYKKVKTHDYITLATYYRLKLPSLLPNVKRVIYFDCDFVINSSLKALFNTPMGDSAVAGVLDIDKRKVKKNPTYVNAGMLIFDIENMRKQNLEEKFLNWTSEHKDTIKCGDQEIINETLKGQISIVNDRWNVQSSNFTNRSSYTNNPRAIHFVARKKPWHWGSFSYHRDLYFKYLQMTPWKLNEEELKHWTKDNQRASLVKYFLYRPFFMFRPRFYKALYDTYFKDFCEKIFSVKNYGETHKIIRLFGIKVKVPKLYYLKKKKENPYYYYVKNNIDITTIPPATGQIRDIQLANLALLKELDYVCKQNGLTYWLDFGSVLGAVRHKGFIPWDDDIDVSMMREDCEKIIDAFKKSSRNPDIYADYYCDRNKNCIIKVQHKRCPHLFVDIFTSDFCEDCSNQENRMNKTKVSRKLIEDTRKKISDNIGLSDLINTYKKMIKGNIGEIKNKKDIIFGLEFCHTFQNWVFSSDLIFPLSEIEFEKEKFPVVNKPEEYLKLLYKNYMGYPKKIGFGHNSYSKFSKEELKFIKSLKNSVQEGIDD